MTEVVFYEKPGCISNNKQKLVLAKQGHRLLVRNILTERWSPERLRPFFGAKPVSAWFNPTAPRVRDGDIAPTELSEAEALALMVDEPLLIRRPLMETPEGSCSGFEDGPVLEALGIRLAPDEDLQSCSRTPRESECPPPGALPVRNPGAAWS